VVGGSEGLAGPDAADIGDAEDDDEGTVDVVASSEMTVAAEAAPAESLPAPSPAPVPAPVPAQSDQLSALPRESTPPPDEPTPQAPEPPDPGPPDR
jgi:hypothetical protein